MHRRHQSVLRRMPHQHVAVSCFGDRRGFTLLEVLAAAGMIGVLFLVTIPLLSHVRLVRQEADRRMIAQQEAANVMESLAALSLRTKLTDADFDAMKLSAAADRLPNAALSIVSDKSSVPLAGRRITVSVGWTTDAGGAALPAELSAWFPAQGGE